MKKQTILLIQVTYYLFFVTLQVTRLKAAVRTRFAEHYGIPIAPNYYNMEHYKPVIDEYIQNLRQVFDTLGTACIGNVYIAQ
jgi:hypothetical protein